MRVLRSPRIAAPPVLAIVDGYSTGHLLPGRMRDRGFACVHVRSRPDMPAYFSSGFQAADYLDDLAGEDVPRLVKELTSAGISQVVAGTESGVLLADALAATLGLPGNRPAQARARRDKSQMAAAAAAAGLAVPRGGRFTSAEDALAWCRSCGLSRVVVKPVDSAGTDNVWFCDRPGVIRRACESVLASANLYGDQNTAVIVQERVEGTEFYVNTVSHGGLHRVAEMWRYTKAGDAASSPVYDFEEPVDMRSPQARTLREFVFAVLDALGVQTSAAHTEVMLTGSGPVLIECGARLSGATAPDVVARYSGVSQLDLLADALASPGRLAGFDDLAVTWSARVRNVAFRNLVAGEVASMDWVAAIGELPTVVAVLPAVRPGAALPVTRDLIDSPGYAYLAGTTSADVQRDYLRLRAMEQDGLYTCAPRGKGVQP